MSFMSIAALALPPEPLQPSGLGRVLIAVGPDPMVPDQRFVVLDRF